ncbi:hypothetical protein KTH_30720 [Thermosporothrix hazakensis]|nr:hypothetical protein KTH_30720 [Thermosporothrix hazakensis]
MTVQWHSFLLHPPGSPPISPEKRAQIESMQGRLKQMAREQYGIEINAGPFGTNSLPALVGAKYAEAQGKGDAYHRAVMNAYWRHAQPIGEMQVLRELAISVGLDGDAFLGALEEETDYTAAVWADHQQAEEYGLQAVPALIFAGKYLVSGAQPYEVLKQVVERVREEMTAN